MNVSTQEKNGFWVVRLEGRLDIGNAAEFEKECLAWIGQGQHRLVLDFGGLEYISSAGLRSILMVAKQVKARSGRLILTGLTDEVREVFHLSGFHTILRICDTKEAALAELA